MRPADTSPEAWKVFIDIQRRLTPAEKIQRAFSHAKMLNQLAESGLRRRFPQADDRQIFLMRVRLNLGEELFRKAYGDELAEAQLAR